MEERIRHEASKTRRSEILKLRAFVPSWQFLFLLSFLAWPSGCHMEHHARTGTPAAQVDQLMNSWIKSGEPGAAVVVEQYGKPLLERSYGLANLQTHEPI